MSDDLKKLSVSALKELARKHLGKGFSRLKTKAALVEALQKIVVPAGTAVVRAAKAVGSGPSPLLKTGAQERPRTTAAHVTTFRKPEPALRAGNGKKASEPPKQAPVVEGFFVVRVAGTGEAERHQLTESSGRTPPPQPPPAGYDEQLGELPDVYEDDAELLLPRDPHTLFFLWDYSRDTRQSALAGLHEPHARIRVYDGDQLVRELDFALESRSYYIHGLEPGRNYRVEAYFVGDNGEARRLGRGTNVIALPNAGPSSNLEVRFLRIPWEVPLSRLKELLRHSRDAASRLPVPARIPLPSSQTSRAAAPEESAPARSQPRVGLPSSHGAGASRQPSSASGLPSRPPS
jgi:hypothetical protein